MPLQANATVAIPADDGQNAQPGVKTLLNNEIQLGNNWCWAACAAMLLDHLQQPMTQCAIADQVLNQTLGTCAGANQNCSPDSSSPINSVCDVRKDPSFVYNVLTVNCNTQDGVMSFGDIQSNIDSPASSPIQVIIQWNSDVSSGVSSHTILIVGWYTDETGQNLWINDPDNDNDSQLGSQILYSDLPKVKGMGTWTQSLTF